MKACGLAGGLQCGFCETLSSFGMMPELELASLKQRASDISLPASVN